MKKTVEVLLCLTLVFCLFGICGCKEEKKDNKNTSSKSTSSVTSSASSKTESSSSTTTSSEVSQPEEKKSQDPSLGIAKDIPSNASPNKYENSTLAPAIQPGPSYSGHNSSEGNEDIDNNMFMDALTYCGYSIKKQKDAGRMWQYVLSKDKKETGWLSNITYSGSSSGYERTPQGAPDIQKFERGGLVCASYLTYVYFNYLPAVKGVDTSMLTKPVKSYRANDWYEACLDWEKKGYTKRLNFTSSGSAGAFLRLDTHDEIPIGSIVCLAPQPGSPTCSHVCIYAGYKNNYHWVTHVGNENGPEFCSIERMTFGPDPQYMLAIFATPTVVK